MKYKQERWAKEAENHEGKDRVCHEWEPKNLSFFCNK